MDLRSVNRRKEWRRSDHIDLSGLTASVVPLAAGLGRHPTSLPERSESVADCAPLLAARHWYARKWSLLWINHICLAPGSAAPCLASFAARTHALTHPGAIEHPVATETAPRSSLTLYRLDRSFLCHGVYLVLG